MLQIDDIILKLEVQVVSFICLHGAVVRMPVPYLREQLRVGGVGPADQSWNFSIVFLLRRGFSLF